MAALTKDFIDTVRARAQREPHFRRGLLRDAIDILLSGEIVTAKILLRDYINATIGFESLARATGIPAKSLHRMLGAEDNPKAQNLLDVLAHLQRAEGVQVQTTLRRKAS